MGNFSQPTCNDHAPFSFLVNEDAPNILLAKANQIDLIPDSVTKYVPPYHIVLPFLTNKPTKRNMSDKPSRAKTPYNYFYKEMFQEIVIHQDNDDDDHNNHMDHFHLDNQETIRTCSHVSVFHVIANRWKRLRPQEKQYYHDLAAADKQRYMQEMAEWHHHHHHPCRHNHALDKSPRR